MALNYNSSERQSHLLSLGRFNNEDHLILENEFNNGISSLRHFDKHFECHSSKHHVWQVVKPLPTQDQKG